MTGPDRLEWNDTTPPRNDDSDRVVVPLPRRRSDAARLGEGHWEFHTDIRWIAGAEGTWLRQELAAVIRDLLIWAHDDISRHTDGPHGEDERAA